MEDMERYGDYNDTDDTYEYDEDGKKRTKWFSLVLKIIIFGLTAIIVAFLGFRMWLFNYYPDSVSNIVFTDDLIEYYNSNKEINALTQDMRFPYDDPDLGHFFAENLIIVEEAGNLQISIRFNESAIKDIEEEYGITGLDINDPELLSFRLFRNNENVPEGEEQNPDYQFIDEAAEGTLSYSANDEFLMYRYVKLVFSDVDFGDIESKDGPKWLALAIYIKGVSEDAPYSRILIYENNDTLSTFSEYRINEEDMPK